jgi:hypothetical protein
MQQAAEDKDPGTYPTATQREGEKLRSASQVCVFGGGFTGVRPNGLKRFRQRRKIQGVLLNLGSGDSKYLRGRTRISKFKKLLCHINQLLAGTKPNHTSTDVGD